MAVTQARIDGVRVAVDWAAAEGWNPGRADAECFFAADRAGFLAASIGGRIVGSISAVRYGSSFGFVGLFIVAPEFRGGGVGARLWAEALSRLEDRVVGLDGVVAMQEAYARSGFVLAHRNVRFGGRSVRLESDADDATTLSSDDVDALVDYDERCFGARRREFLSAWLSQPDVVARAVERDGRVSGYGVMRQCREGVKIGPLFADDADTAETLLASLVSQSRADSMVYIDVPETNTPAREMAERRGMSPVFETARMYRGGDPGLPLHRVFGITSFELG